MQSTICDRFVDVVTELTEQVSIDGFSGIGLILYNNAVQFSDYHCNLIVDQQPIPELALGDPALVTYLIEISHYQHRYHDGFHLINSSGILTNVAQFVAPPIATASIKILDHGARTLCALLTSRIPSVVLTASISSDISGYIFDKGKALLINELIGTTP